jgi:hypothetical protein
LVPRLVIKLVEQFDKIVWCSVQMQVDDDIFLTGGCETYPDRFNQLYKAIHDKYPHITIIASHGIRTHQPLLIGSAAGYQTGRTI